MCVSLFVKTLYYNDITINDRRHLVRISTILKIGFWQNANFAKFWLISEEYCHFQNILKFLISSPNILALVIDRCKWIDAQVPGGPSCIFEIGKQGYKMIGSEEVTDFGYRVHLERIDGPKIYDGALFKNITVDIEYHSDHRLRIKVRSIRLHRRLSY